MKCIGRFLSIFNNTGRFIMNNEKQGYSIKAAVPLSDEYAQDCVLAFSDRSRKVNFSRLLKDALPVDFTTETKTDYIVIRLSCAFLDATHQSVGVIHRSDRDHSQNAGVNSLLISSELISTYTFIKMSGGLLINPYYPFTQKLGAYLGAFDLDPNCWFGCLRRQKDKRTGATRYYAFYTYLATVTKPDFLPSQFALFGNVSSDMFTGFWPLDSARRRLPKDDLEVDAFAAASLLNENYTHPDIVPVVFRKQLEEQKGEQPVTVNVRIDKRQANISSITAGNVAVNSDGARQNQGNPEELSKLFNTMIQALRRDSNLDKQKQEAAVSDVGVLANELSKPEPRKPIVDTLLSSLGSLASIASLVNEVYQFLPHL